MSRDGSWIPNHAQPTFCGVGLRHSNDIAGLPSEISAAGFHNGRRTRHPNVEPTPLAAVRGFDGQHILLPELGNQSSSDEHGLYQGACEHELSASPFSQIAQV